MDNIGWDRRIIALRQVRERVVQTQARLTTQLGSIESRPIDFNLRMPKDRQCIRDPEQLRKVLLGRLGAEHEKLISWIEDIGRHILDLNRHAVSPEKICVARIQSGGKEMEMEVNFQTRRIDKAPEVAPLDLICWAPAFLLQTVTRCEDLRWAQQKLESANRPQPQVRMVMGGQGNIGEADRRDTIGLPRMDQVAELMDQELVFI